MSEGRFQRNWSIKFKLVLLLIGLAAATVVAITGLALDSTRTSSLEAQTVSSNEMRNQARDFMSQLTIKTADENDQKLRAVQEDAEALASYIASIYEDPDILASERIWKDEEELISFPSGQTGNDPNAITSLFVPNFVEMNSDVENDILLTSYLDPILPAFFHNGKSTEAIYFATPREIVRYYPNVNLGEVLPPDFTASQRVWFSDSLKDKNPSGSSWWTPVYVDATGLGLVTTAARPVYAKTGELIGVFGIDFTLENIKESVEATQALPGGYFFLIDNSGQPIAMPPQAQHDVLGDRTGDKLTDIDTAFKTIITPMLAGERGFDSLMVDGKELFVAYAPLSSTGWSLASVVPADQMLQPSAVLRRELENRSRSLIFRRILPVSAAIFLAVALIGYLVTNNLIRPMQQLTTAANQISQGNWDINFPTPSRDEFGVLANAFGTMVNHLKDVVKKLEDSIAERTSNLEHRSAQLRRTTEVTREFAAMTDMDQLMEKAVKSIRQRFDFSFTGLFLLDPTEEYVVLQAAAGQTGQGLPEKGLRIRLGESSLIAEATRSNQAQSGKRKGSDPFYLQHTSLPESNTEVALPLRAQDQLLGVLDIQSTSGGEFDVVDITVLQIVADQLAQTIQNIRLIAEMNLSMQELEKAYEQYTSEKWQEFLHQSRKLHGYRYSDGRIRAVESWRPEAQVALRREATVIAPASETAYSGEHVACLAVPIRLRQQVIGVVNVRSRGGQVSKETVLLLEEAASRLALMLENVRLLEDARENAAREQLVTEVTGRLRESLDFDIVLKNAVREVGQALGLAEVVIELKDTIPGNGANGKQKEQA